MEVDQPTKWPSAQIFTTIIVVTPWVSSPLLQLTMADPVKVMLVTHAHKCVCMVVPLYSKIQVLPGIISCRLMKDNKQQVDLTCLLRMTWPNNVIGK